MMKQYCKHFVVILHLELSQTLYGFDVPVVTTMEWKYKMYVPTISVNPFLAFHHILFDT